MLIESHRHTKADIELWNDLEEVDLVWYASHKMKDIENNAIQEIITFSKTGPFYISVSWGKDSVVVAHLCFRAKIKMPLVYVKPDSPRANPDAEKVKEIFLNKYHWEYIEKTKKEDPIINYKNVGFSEVAKEIKTERYVSGVRAKESNVRNISAAVHGVATKKTCRPIIHWGHNDVFAYLAHYVLPVHPAYAMLGGGRFYRDKIRVAAIGGEQGDGLGRAEWEREYYGDILNRVSKWKQARK